MDEVLALGRSGGADVVDKYLSLLQSVPHDQIDDSSLASVIDICSKWIKSSNYKSCTVALQCMHYLTEVTQEMMKTHMITFIPALVEKLGDTKDQVRELAMNVVTALMSEAATPQQVMELLAPALKHRNPKVKINILAIVDSILDKYGSHAITISKILLDICLLVSDPTEQVREAAQNTLIEIFRHVGERIRMDIDKKDAIPQAKRILLFQQFDAIAAHGQMMARDDDDRMSVRSTQSMPVPRKSSAPVAASKSRISTLAGHSPPSKSMGTDKGGLDEYSYNDTVRSTIPINVQSAQEIEREFSKMAPVIADERNADWELRVAHLIRIRGLAAGNGPSYDSFLTDLKILREALPIGIRDLRSAVSREATLTVAKLAEVFGDRFECCVDQFVPELLKQVVINVKVIADSSNLCMRYIIKSMRSRLLLGRLIENIDAKAVTLRKRVSEYMLLVLEEWDGAFLTKSATGIQKYLGRSMSDADSAVRATARRAYWLFDEKFHDLAHSLYLTLDPAKQKTLVEDRDKVKSAPTSAPSVAAPRASAIGVSKLAPPARASIIAAPHVSSAVPVKPRASAYGSSALLATKTPTRGPQKLGLDESFPDNVSDISMSSSKSFSKTPKKDNLMATHPPVTPGSRLPFKSNQPSGYLGSAKKAESSSVINEMSRPQRVAASRQSLMPRAGELAGGARRVQKDSSAASSTASLSLSSTIRVPVSRSLPNTRPPSAQSGQALNKSGPLTVDPLADIALLFSHTDWAQRMDAVQHLKSYLLADPHLNPSQIDRLNDFFVQLLTEPNKNVFSEILDVLHHYVGRYPGEMAWASEVLSGLFFHVSSMTSGPGVAKMSGLFDLLRHSHPPEQQLSRVIAFLLNPNFSHVQSRASIVEYMLNLMPLLNEAIIANLIQKMPTDFVAFLERISDYSHDNHGELSRLSTQLIVEIYHLNPSKFCQLFSEVDPRSASMILSVMDQRVPDWNSRLSPTRNGAESPRNVTSPSLRGSMTKIPVPASSAQKSAISPSNSSSNMLPPLRKTASDIGIAVNPVASPPLPIRHPSSTLVKPQPVSTMPVNAPQKVHYPYVDETEQDYLNGSYSSMQSESVHASSSELQAAVLSLHENDGQQQTTEDTLQWLIKVAKEKHSHVWSTQFNVVLGTVMHLFADPDDAIRESAIKLVRELIKYQSAHIADNDALILNKLLERHKDTSPLVLRVTEEALGAFVSVISPLRCCDLLEPIINNEQSVAVLLPAIKMLTKAVKRLSVDELEASSSSIIVGLFKGYRHVAAEVRKAVVFALVEIHLIAPQVIAPHLSTLSGSQLKLLQIYIKKAEEKLAGGAAKEDVI